MPKIYISREISSANIYGGIGTHYRNLLKSNGDKLTFITSKISIDAQIETRHKIYAYRTEGFKNVGTRNPFLNLILLVWYRLRVAQTVLAHSRVSKTLVEAPEYMFEAIFLALIPRPIRKNITLITRLHGPTAFDRSDNVISAKTIKDRIFWALERLQINRSDDVVAPTAFGKSLFQPYIKREIRVEPNCFTPSRTTKRHDGKITLTYIGSGHPSKGTPLLDQLLSLLPDEMLDSFGGYDPGLPNVKRLLLTNDLLISKLSEKRRVLLVPSLSETYGYTMIEGLHYCEHVLASDIPVFREVVSYYNHTNFTLLDPHDLNAWRQEIEKLLK